MTTGGTVGAASEATGARQAPAPTGGARPGFRHALHHALHHAAHRHHAHAHTHPRHHAPRPVAVGAGAQSAIDQAIAREGVPASWRHSLLFIVQQESGGRVGVRNPTDSARGLFQITRAHWHLNPHGAASFGNAPEEAQGGIRYIQARYATAERAERFWRAHGWY